MSYWFFLILPFLIFSTPVFAQTPESDEISTKYDLKIEQGTYSIPYNVNADIIAMEIDTESKSLLVGLDNSFDSQFVITLQHELINAKNNEFVILVDSQEVDYKITSDSTSSTFALFVPTGSEEVEIIGTSVVPEFPIGAIFGFAVMITSILVFAKIKAPFFKL